MRNKERWRVLVKVPNFLGSSGPEPFPFNSRGWEKRFGTLACARDLRRRRHVGSLRARSRGCARGRQTRDCIHCALYKFGPNFLGSSGPEPFPFNSRGWEKRFGTLACARDLRRRRHVGSLRARSRGCARGRQTRDCIHCALYKFGLSSLGHISSTLPPCV